MNRLLFLFLCCPAGMSAHAQSDTSHRFLWFTGHWSPAKKNTFVATGLYGNASGSASSGAPTGGGTTVTIGNNGTVHVSSPGIDSWNRWVHGAVASGQQFIQQLENPHDNLDPATHHLYQLMLPDAEEYQQELQDIGIDAAQDILSPDISSGQSTGSGQYGTSAGSSQSAGSDGSSTSSGSNQSGTSSASNQSGTSSGSGQSGTSPVSGQFTGASQSGQSAGTQPTDDYCRQAKADYDEVISWWKAHRHDKYEDLTYSPPPGLEYNCYSCDSGMRSVYQQTIDNYVRDFFHPEDNLLNKAFAIMKARYLSPCSYMDMDDISTAAYDIAHHAFSRADKMMHENRKNFKAVEAVAKTWLKAAHDLIMIGGDAGIENEGLAEIGAIRALAVDYYLGELQHNDWRQIGNIPFLIDLMHKEALTSGKESGSGDFPARLRQIWNGFELSIDMDIKVGRDGGYVIIHQKGKCHIIPAFQQDSNQCYKWVVADENKVDKQGFFMPSALQTIDCNLLDAEMITPRARPKYIGTKYYRTTLKSLSMDFCNPGHDTILLTNLYPNPTTAGLWEMPGAGALNLGDNGVDEFFQSLADRKRLADDGEAKKAAAQMKQQAQQLVAQMQTLKTQMGSHQGAANYEKMMELAQKARSLSTAPAAGKMMYVDFILPVQNNNAVLVDKRWDAKEINPTESAVIVYGYYTIHIENAGKSK